jgi:hypothetical protein
MPTDIVHPENPSLRWFVVSYRWPWDGYWIDEFGMIADIGISV